MTVQIDLMTSGLYQLKRPVLSSATSNNLKINSLRKSKLKKLDNWNPDELRNFQNSKNSKSLTPKH